MIALRRLSVALILIGALAGCGGDSPGSAGAGSAAVAAKQLGSTGEGGAGGSSSDSSSAATNDAAQIPAADQASMRLTQYVNPLIGTLASNSPNPVPAGQAGSGGPPARPPQGRGQRAPRTKTNPAPL